MNDKNQSVAYREEYHEHHIPMSRYVAVFVALLVLTALTVWTGTMELGAASLPIALVIATTKGLLVALYFMHLADAEGMSRVTLGISVFFVVLIIMFVLADVNTRFQNALPEGSRLNPVPAQTSNAAPADAAPAGN